jgi:hypothetical protein
MSIILLEVEKLMRKQLLDPNSICMILGDENPGS